MIDIRCAAVDVLLDAVWSRGDADAARMVIAPIYVIHHDPGDPWEGRALDHDAYVERVRQSRAPFPDQHFAVTHRAVEGDRVAVAWTWAATHAGDLPGFPASNRRITMSGMTFYLFDGDRISGHWQISDRLGVYRQLQGG